MMKKTIRLLTVKSSGMQYVVQNLELQSENSDENFAHTYGELVRFDGRKAWFEGSKKFRMNEVTVEEIPWNPGIYEVLFFQSLKIKESEGQKITQKGRDYYLHGTPLDRAKLAHSQYRASRILQNSVRKETVESMLFRLAESAEKGGLDDQAEAILGLIESL